MVYDLIIAGGGINGAALGRLAAFQSLKVALFENGDFGQGASTNTSKLLHGGLRYLETYDFGLVRDATHERAELLNIAPHLVEARHFLFPKTRLGRHNRPMIKAGLTLYDFLAGKLKISPHRWVSPKELARLEPFFLPEEKCGAYEYSDCVMDDARLVIENLVDARSLGAEIWNYRSFQGMERGRDGILDVTVLDRISGKEIVYQTRKLAMTLGPWTDQVLAKSFRGTRPQVRLSQGIHLIADGLPSHSCFILPVPKSRRYFFVVPWKGKHLIGTTETEVGDYPPNPALPKEEEIQELLALTRTFFPGQNPIVICTITGLRPLARSTQGSTITLSREHEFHQMEEGVFSAVGGKYTTHRTFAEQFLKFILGSGVVIKNIKPRLLPGAWNGEMGRSNLETKLLAYSFVDAGICKAWMRRYGMRALELADYVASIPNGEDRVSITDSVLYGEVRFAYEREWAKTPTDFFRRRTDIYFTAGAGLEMLPKAKAIFLAGNPMLEKSLGLDADYPDFLRGNRHRAIL